MYSTHTGKEFCICNIGNLENTGESIPKPVILSLIYWNNEANNFH